MTEVFETPWVLPLTIVVVLLVIVFVWRRFFGRGTPLERALAEIAFERIEKLVIPSADEGSMKGTASNSSAVAVLTSMGFSR